MDKKFIFQKILCAFLLLPLSFLFLCGFTSCLLLHLIFGKKKKKVNLEEEPSCLDDPKFGKHDYLELKTRDILKIHYVANGDRSKPLMLFLHGFPQFWYTWKNQLVEFGKDYYAVAIDMPGYGYSDKPKDKERYAADELSLDVKAFIKELGYESCVLVGHDWGAAIAFHTAIEHPEVVSKLINMNAPHKQAFLDNISVMQLFRSSYMFFFQIPFFSEYVCSICNYFILDVIFTNGTNPEYYTDDEINAYKYMFHKSGFTGSLNYYRNVLNTLHDKGGSGNVEVPSVLIWGTDDTALGVGLAAATDKYLVNGKVVYVDGISHFVHTDAPDAVHKHMREFLEGSN